MEVQDIVDEINFRKEEAGRQAKVMRAASAQTFDEELSSSCFNMQLALSRFQKELIMLRGNIQEKSDFMKVLNQKAAQVEKAILDHYKEGQEPARHLGFMYEFLKKLKAKIYDGAQD